MGQYFIRGAVKFSQKREQEAKKFPTKNKRDLGMVYHTPPLKK